MLEIERRFLVDVDLGRLGAVADRVKEVQQGYLSTGQPEVRIRRSPGGRHMMAVKVGTGVARREVEFEVGEDTARQLWTMVESRFVQKTRYLVGRWEFDVFHGPYEGLVIAEIELASDAELMLDPSRIQPWPTGLVQWWREVTENELWNNRNLAASASYGRKWCDSHPRWDGERVRAWEEAVAWAKAQRSTDEPH